MVIASVVARLSLCFVLFFLCAARVEAQVYAKCPFGWEWVRNRNGRLGRGLRLTAERYPQAQNSLKQDPCEIVSLLESQCRETRWLPSFPLFSCDSDRASLETVFRVPALSPPEVANYSRPSLSSPALQCECNIPVFKYVPSE